MISGQLGISHLRLASLSAGDMEGVGSAMSSCHERLRNLGVSCNELENLISAVDSHSLGAKLTGAGGEVAWFPLLGIPRESLNA